MRNFWKSPRDRSRCDWIRHTNPGARENANAGDTADANVNAGDTADEFVPPLITYPERISALHELAQREPCNYFLEHEKRTRYVIRNNEHLCNHQDFPNARDLIRTQDEWTRFVHNAYSPTTSQPSYSHDNDLHQTLTPTL